VASNACHPVAMSAHAGPRTAAAAATSADQMEQERCSWPWWSAARCFGVNAADAVGFGDRRRIRLSRMVDPATSQGDRGTDQSACPEKNVLDRIRHCIWTSIPRMYGTGGQAGLSTKLNRSVRWQKESVLAGSPRWQ
jgi:hypothetical protein